MKTFPVLSSIVAPQLLNHFIQNQYQLDLNTTCHVFRTGINHTYIVKENEDKYIFRLYCHNWRSKEEIEEELTFINSLKNNKVSVSYPIADKNGAYLQEINAPEGLRYAVLFSYAEGEKIRILSEQDCYQMGILLAHCHKVSQKKILNRIHYNIETLVTLPCKYTLKHHATELEGMQFLYKAEEYLKTRFQQEETVALRHGIVHLDFWYDNMNITEGSKITLFDFDFCGNGWLMLDLSYCIMQLFHTESDKNIFEQKASKVYEGYESILPINKEEKELIPAAGLAVWIFYLGVQSQRFDDWSNIFLTKNYLKHYIGMVKSWLTYNKIAL